METEDLLSSDSTLPDVTDPILKAFTDLLDQHDPPCKEDIQGVSSSLEQVSLFAQELSHIKFDGHKLFYEAASLEEEAERNKEEVAQLEHALKLAKQKGIAIGNSIVKHRSKNRPLDLKQKIIEAQMETARRVVVLKRLALREARIEAIRRVKRQLGSTSLGTSDLPMEEMGGDVLIQQDDEESEEEETLDDDLETSSFGGRTQEDLEEHAANVQEDGLYGHTEQAHSAEREELKDEKH